MSLNKVVDALEWYERMAKQMGDAVLDQDNQRVLHLMKEIAVDHGRRAREALAVAVQA